MVKIKTIRAYGGKLRLAHTQDGWAWEAIGPYRVFSPPKELRIGDEPYFLHGAGSNGQGVCRRMKDARADGVNLLKRTAA
jgi:hypothetical protein